VQDAKWLSIDDYALQSLNHGVLKPFKQKSMPYNFELVQQFAYQIHRWCFDRRNGIQSGEFKGRIVNMREEVKPEDQRRKISRFEEPTLTFENALYLHIEKQDYKKARALYLRAIQRALFPWPAFSMLLNVHLLHAHSKEHLEDKIKDLKLTYGPFLSIHSDFQSHLDRCLKYSKLMEEDPSWQLKQKNF